MAQYNSYKSYNIEQFEPRVVSTSNAAPKMKPAPQKRPQLELVRKPRPNATQVRGETQLAARQAKKIFVIAMTILMFMAMVIYSRVQLDEINRDISNKESAIELAQSDSIKLNNALSSMVSINNVEEYAANVLGMVKVQDYQVVYVDLSSNDSVVVANGKQTGQSDVIKANNK
ncbi:MAG: hypothetical protein IKW45_03510 [Clostridia bacterium]|nr:hypothetical protein [Clostridia bacterium]